MKARARCIISALCITQTWTNVLTLFYRISLTTSICSGKWSVYTNVLNENWNKVSISFDTATNSTNGRGPSITREYWRQPGSGRIWSSSECSKESIRRHKSKSNPLPLRGAQFGTNRRSRCSPRKLVWVKDRSTNGSGIDKINRTANSDWCNFISNYY